MKKIILAILMAVVFVGCGGDTSNTYLSDEGSTPEGNATETTAPVQLVTPPYGSGAAFDPYVVNQNGIYVTNDTETYYRTSLIQEYCLLSIKPVGKDVYYVNIVDGEDYTPIDFNFEQGVWTMYSEELSFYRILVNSYKKEYVEIYSSCW